ncbi:MAG: aldo/keto reductase, partial [Actinobacteria bacterium]|nr:aldo/keto reductase [Actinomycetota bacterium]
MKKRSMVSGYEISPVIKGGWQLSSGHSLDRKIEDEQAVADTVSFIEAGISTLDFGDIYTGVEELIGRA